MIQLVLDGNDLEFTVSILKGQLFGNVAGVVQANVNLLLSLQLSLDGACYVYALVLNANCSSLDLLSVLNSKDDCCGQSSSGDCADNGSQNDCT